MRLWVDGMWYDRIYMLTDAIVDGMWYDRIYMLTDAIVNLSGIKCLLYPYE